jgi:hypothetical protein
MTPKQKVLGVYQTALSRYNPRVECWFIEVSTEGTYYMWSVGLTPQEAWRNAWEQVSNQMMRTLES